MSYSPHNIRNVCLLGHGGNGKTTLVESFLYMTGARDRLGRTTDGNTICDYDPEEVKRQISISAAVAPIEYNGCKINVLDTPGNFDFAGEVVESLSVADAAVLVCAAKGGLEMFTKALAVEVAKYGIRVNCVAPGFIMTKLSDRYKPSDLEAFQNRIPVGFLGQTEHIVPAILFMAGEETTRYITGQVLRVDGGQTVTGNIESMKENF